MRDIKASAPHSHIMGEYVNGWLAKLAGAAMALLLIVLNFLLIFNTFIT